MKKLDRKQICAAVLMLSLGGVPAGAAGYYKAEPPEELPVIGQAGIAEPVMQPIVAETGAVVETIASTVAEEAAAEDFVPHVVQLNLAYRYPEGADETNPLASSAGSIFKTLMEKDEAWMSNLYDQSDLTPEQMAAQLGKPRSSVIGLYNANDDWHDPDNPDTWTVNSFKKVHIQLNDGDGKTSGGFSNVIPIMSMASVYTWFEDMEDQGAFLDYALNLWNKSHSYSVSMGEVYYCSGCMNEKGEAHELEELLAEDALEREAAAASEDDGTGQPEEGSTDGAETALKSTTGLEAQTDAAETTAAQSGANAQNAEAPWESTGETAAETAQTGADSAAGIQMQAGKTAAAGPGVLIASDSNAQDSAETNAAKIKYETADCPGHVDLYINAKVVGLDEKNNLLMLDSIGNNSENITEGGWEGWNTYTKSYAVRLSKQDWFERYGLSVSSLSLRNPLTKSEIDDYIAELPAGMSEEKLNMIRFALGSVGRVPYYWGGKPNAPGYEGNNFYTVTRADEEGRIMRGLDCSGWVNWVYWSSTGSRLPYESTSGLAVCGKRIKRSELEPGDIIIRTGANAHVIMFLGWEEDGRVKCVNETSGGINNVTITVRDANWPYYVRLMD